MIEAVQFRDERIYSGLSREDAAELLGVSLRTIGHWETGRVRVGYAAFKLLRVYRHGDIADPAWATYKISRGKLRTPEGHEFGPGDVSWLCLLVRRAALAAEITRQRDALRVQLSAIEAAVGAAERSLGLVYYQTSDTPRLETLRHKGFHANLSVVSGANVVPQWHHEYRQADSRTFEPSPASGSEGSASELRRHDGYTAQHCRDHGFAELPPVRHGEIAADHAQAEARVQPKAEGDQGCGGKCLAFSGGEAASKSWQERPLPMWQWPESEGLPPRAHVARQSA